jgi:toxin ParE1/3/4
VRLSHAAESDLDDIVFWTADRYGEKQARIYERVLKDMFASLREGPSVAGARHRPEIAQGLYSLHTSKSWRRARHFVFFHLIATNEIEIVRVLHDGMDFRRHLPSDEAGET